MTITASALNRLAVCPASGALPEVRVESAAMSRGSAAHDYLDNLADVEPEAALAVIAVEHRDYCASIDLDKVLPIVRAPGVRTETAYAYNVATGEVRYIGRRIGRAYGPLAATEIAGSMDVEILEPGVVHIRDWKVGFGIDLLAPPPEKNRQLRTYALMAARHHGVDRATIGRVRIDENGSVWPDRPVDLDAFDLDDIADEVGRIHAAMQRAKVTIAEGRTPAVSESGHCAYCPAFNHCPAKKSLALQLGSAPQEIEDFVAASLTPDNTARAYERIKLAKLVVERAEKAVQEYAARTPIPLDNGMVLGPVETTRESIDGGLAHAVLAEEYGEDVAEAACKLEATKVRLRDALKGYAHRTGEKLAPVERQALALLRDRGAIQETTTTTVKEHRVKEGK